MTVKTVMGPGGAPMRRPYGSFAGKPSSQRNAVLTVMGPMGAPMRPPYGSFANKVPTPPSSSGMFTVSGGWVSLTFPEFFVDVVLTDAPVCKRTN